jgi:hypothetical protein
MHFCRIAIEIDYYFKILATKKTFLKIFKFEEQKTIFENFQIRKKKPFLKIFKIEKKIHF